MSSQLAASADLLPVARRRLQLSGAESVGRAVKGRSQRCEHPAVQADHEAAVRRAIVGMHEMLYQTLRLEDAAAAAIYSRFHFHRTFRQITSTTPARFLASLRMQRAKQLLADSDMTVTLISGLVGYESLGTFTTQFGRLVGLAPGRFRQLVDACGDRRLSEFDLGSPAGGRLLPVLCTAPRGTRLTGRTTLIGLFESELPSGSPTGFTMLRDGGSADIMPPAGRSVLALSVPDDILLSELAVGSIAGALVGRATMSGGGPGGVLDLQLHRPRLVDPPVVSAAPVQYLLGRR